MLPLSLLCLTLSAALVQTASAAMTTTVCSPFSCLNIPLPLSSLPQIGGASSNGSYLLLPGTYAHPLPPALQANTSTSAPLAGLQPFDNFTLSSSASPFYLVPSLQGAMLYDGVFWSGGQGEGFAQGRRAADNATFKAQSVILSPASWLKLGVVGGGEYVVWSSLADLEDGPLGIGRKKGFKVLDAQSAACATPCAAGGACVSNDVLGRNGTCVCSPGFSGLACEQCAPGHWGPECLDCASHCETRKCSDGLQGNGQCAATPLVNSTTTCSCLNGQCTGSTASLACTCSAGWASPSLTANHPTYATLSNHLQCSICASGFTLLDGECVACGPYATACSSDRTATACVKGFEVELGSCVPSNGPSGKGSECSGANFWDLASFYCSPCSPTCGGKCFGPSSADCLNCSAGKGLLQGRCVDVDSARKTCDQASAGFGASQGFWLNPAIGACDSCPTKSTGCVALDSSRSEIKATACLDGHLLTLEGVCVETCPLGSFRDGDSRVCHACSSSCASCEGYASYCTACPSGQLTMSGSCVSTCAASTFVGNGTCATCHGDCATCSGPSFDQCLSCPASRPVLSNGRCLPVCEKSQFFDAASGSCSSCDKSCSSCTGPSANECLSCASADATVSSSTCAPSSCPGGFVPYLSVCLDHFLTKSVESTPVIHVLTILIPLLVVFAIVGALLFVRHERKKTREASERWAAGMDDIQVRKTTQSTLGHTGVDGVLAFMGRTRDDLGRRWKTRNDVKRVRARQRGLKPLKLAAGWQTKEDDERAYGLEGSRNVRRQPPPYTPTAIDDDLAGFLRQSDKRRLRSLPDEDDDDTDRRWTRPQSRYTIDSPTPSPSYESVAHSQRDPFSRDSLFSIPNLASPAPAACPRPSHLRSQASLAPTDSRPSSRRRSIDLEEEPFPDFQTEYSTARHHPVALGPPQTPLLASRAPSRFVEGEFSDEDLDDEPARARPPVLGLAVRIDSPAADSGTSFDSPAVIRSHYWLADARSEGGRSEQEIRFAPSSSPASTRGDQPRYVGGHNPFQSARL